MSFLEDGVGPIRLIILTNHNDPLLKRGSTKMEIERKSYPNKNDKGKFLCYNALE